MKSLYLLCGMPFSGKTTLGKSVAKYLDCLYISLDEINEARGLYGGDGIPVEEWEKTHFLAMQQLHSFMPSEQNIVLDDTNCFRWLRDRFRDFGSQYGYQTILIFLDVPLAEIWQRIEINNQLMTGSNNILLKV
jgi:predicted kinase